MHDPCDKGIYTFTNWAAPPPTHLGPRQGNKQEAHGP